MGRTVDLSRYSFGLKLSFHFFHYLPFKSNLNFGDRCKLYNFAAPGAVVISLLDSVQDCKEKITAPRGISKKREKWTCVKYVQLSKFSYKNVTQYIFPL
jgi:hypothetical protein